MTRSRTRAEPPATSRRTSPKRPRELVAEGSRILGDKRDTTLEAFAILDFTGPPNHYLPTKLGPLERQ